MYSSRFSRASIMRRISTGATTSQVVADEYGAARRLRLMHCRQARAKGDAVERAPETRHAGVK
jgi:hypothetical protein